MRYLQLLLEYNLDRLIKDFSNKIMSKVQKDNRILNSITNKENPNVAHIIEWMGESDPTPNKEYTFWLASRYANNGIKLLEDIPSKAAPYLTKYHKLKITKQLSPEHRDINKIKTLNDLYDIISQYGEAVSKREESSAEEQRMFAEEEATLVYNDDQIKIVIPHTEAASCFFGKNTQWCTAATDSRNFFDDYNKDGHLYVILIKKENKRFQLHFETEQYMDENDNPIDISNLIRKYHVLWDQVILKELRQSPILIDDLNLNWLTPKMQLQAIDANERAFLYMDHPSIETQIAVVKKNLHNIGWLGHNPSSEVVNAVEEYVMNNLALLTKKLRAQKSISRNEDAEYYMVHEFLKIGIDLTEY